MTWLLESLVSETIMWLGLIFCSFNCIVDEFIDLMASRIAALVYALNDCRA